MVERGQVWVETVLYTLIGLAIIGVALAFLMPKINETRDRVLIEQTISSLNSFDEKMNIVLDEGPGNIRNIELNNKKGEIIISPAEDLVKFVLNEITEPYTEVGVIVEVGRIDILTREDSGDYMVELILDYSGILDLKTDNGDISLGISSIPHRIRLFNIGDEDLDNLEEIEVTLLS
jgi:hypothetical protein